MARFSTTCLFLLTCFPWPAAAQEVKTNALEIPPETVKALLVNRVAPLYPPLARQAHIQGTVVLTVVINKSGEVSDVKLYSGHPMLAPAAIDAVKQWRYRPYEQDGEPVAIQTTVQVNFKLADKPAAENVAGDIPGGVAPDQAPAFHLHRCESSGASTSARIVRVSAGVMQGLMVSKVNPEYPAEAKRAHIEGMVVLGVEIDRNGSVCDVALIAGHPLLAPSAMAAVRQWLYRPYLLNGEPVEVESRVQVFLP